MARSPQKIIDEIIEMTAGEEYIFRGENKDYSEAGGRPLTSNLYRQFCLPNENGAPPIESEYFSIVEVEKDIIDKAKEQYFPSGATDIDVWTQLQHYGGKTALIDFTYNLHIALLLACYGNPDKDGKLFMFPSKLFPPYTPEDGKNKDTLITPTSKDLRVIVQSSVFVHTHKGYLEDIGESFTISPKEKEEMLPYLRKNFNVHEDNIYNDIHGFIKNLDNHSTEDIEFYRGSAWYNKKNYTNAIKCYDKAIEINPQFLEAYYNRGNAKFDLGRHEDAILDYDKAIEINPQYAKAYNNRGNAKSALGKHKEAILDYDKAIEINPQYAKAYNNRGNAKSALGDKENAILDYDKAIEINPQYAEAYSNRGIIKSALTRHKEAILDYDKAIEINPQDATAYNNRGNAKSALGDKDGAERDWLKSKELDGK